MMQKKLSYNSMLKSQLLSNTIASADLVDRLQFGEVSKQNDEILTRLSVRAQLELLKSKKKEQA